MKTYLVQCGCNLCSMNCVLHVPACFGWNGFLPAFYGVPCFQVFFVPFLNPFLVGVFWAGSTNGATQSSFGNEAGAGRQKPKGEHLGNDTNKNFLKGVLDRVR